MRPYTCSSSSVSSAPTTGSSTTRRPEFRDRFLAGPVAERFGPTFVTNLVNRPLAGLSWADYPAIGWATANELGAALVTADAANGGVERPEDVEPLHTLDRAIRRAATMGIDIVTVYG
ncbi:MAG: hypothetical protein M3R63_06185 [Actinomycetota bacterium]|nr:hypothetical protein [Actinomycetota bacterium]